MDHGSERPRRKRWPKSILTITETKNWAWSGIKCDLFRRLSSSILGTCGLMVWCWSRLRLARLFQGAPVLWESNNYWWVVWKYRGWFSGVHDDYLATCEGTVSGGSRSNLATPDFWTPFWNEINMTHMNYRYYDYRLFQQVGFSVLSMFRLSQVTVSKVSQTFDDIFPYLASRNFPAVATPLRSQSVWRFHPEG